MTLPVGSFDPDNLPQGVYKPEDLGTVTQDQSKDKFRASMASRFPAIVNGTSAGDPANEASPLGLITGLAAQLAHRVASADPADITGPEDLLPEIPDFFDVLGDIVPALQQLVDAVQGLLSGDGQFSLLAALMSLRWDQADESAAALVDLQDKTQKLEGVIGYGCRYMSSSPGVTTSASTMPFDTQIGPMVGVTPLSGGRYRLESKGLWRCEAQTYFQTATFAPPRCFMDIVIRTPAGAEFARLKAMGSTDDGLTVTNVMPVVVPAAGYTVEVQAWTSAIPILGGSWRSIAGGLGATRFSVFKISDETS